MPTAYGGDRVRPLDGGGFEIASQMAKGWKPRRPRTLTTAEFPGTAIHWDGELYEVISAVEHSDGRSAYVLRPWAPNHAIRVSFDYDERSEAERAVAKTRSDVRQRHAAGLTLSGLLVGHLPAHVQLEIESEYGILASRMTLLSIVPMVAFAAFAATGLPIEGLPGPKLPTWVLAFGSYAMNDSLVRSFLCLLRGRPCGSVPGLIAWEIWKALSPRGKEFDRRASARSFSSLRSTSLRPQSDFEKERDAFVMREAYVGLLSPDEQLKLHVTFGFDPIKWGFWTAVTIAALAGAGLFASASAIAHGAGTFGKWVSAVSAALLLVEQFFRFAKFRRGEPAGSVLGALVRPWCRNLLSVKPRALAPGSIAPAARKLPDIWEGDPPAE